jgi:hypothetical protein
LTGASTVALCGGVGGEETDVDANTIIALGLGVSPPWKLVEQQLDTTVQPHVLHLEVVVDRGTMFARPQCGKACKVHDFAEFTWRHLNFFVSVR